MLLLDGEWRNLEASKKIYTRRIKILHIEGSSFKTARQYVKSSRTTVVHEDEKFERTHTDSDIGVYVI